MLVYGTQGTKVTETFTGSRFARRTLRTACWSIAEPKNLGAKRNELDDETKLNYFGARYLDPMLGLWISVDPKRQYLNPYLYAGNNPIMRIDPDGNMAVLKAEGQVAKYTLVAASVLDPEPTTRALANGALIAPSSDEIIPENIIPTDKTNVEW